MHDIKASVFDRLSNRRLELFIESTNPVLCPLQGGTGERLLAIRPAGRP